MNILDSVIINHQKFSKSNLGIEIMYLDNGWAVKSDKNVSFVKKNDKIFAVVNNIQYFIKSKDSEADIKLLINEEGQYLYYT